MGTIRSTVRIGRPPEAVWAALVDPERFTAWKQGVVSVDRTDVPLDRPGATYDVTLSAFGRRVAARFEMREVERPVRLVRIGVTGRSTTTTTNRLRAAEGGGTILDFQLSYELPGGPLGALVDRLLVRRLLEREMELSHVRLRALLEAPA